MSRTPSLAVRYLKVARADFFISSILPVMIASSAALYFSAPLRGSLLPLVLVGVVSLHAMVNLTNEYNDYKRGVDLRSGNSPHLIASSQVTPREAAVLAYISFGVSFAVLLILAYFRGWLLLFIGLFGIAAGYSYTGPPLAYKYRSLGDIMIFLFMGPFLVLGAYYALTGEISLNPVIASFPQGLLIAAVLNSNNIRDINEDRSAGIRTLPMLIEIKKASGLYSFTLFISFGWVVFWVLAGVFPVYSLAVLVCAPRAVSAAGRLRRLKETELENIDFITLKIYLGVNTLLASSFIAGVFL